MIYFPGMIAKSLTLRMKLLIICALAVGANYLLNTLSLFIFKLPLFLDTVFTCAVAFAAGPVPGIAVAALSIAVTSIRDNSTWIFVLCSITEVLLIWLMKPGVSRKDSAGRPETGRGMSGLSPETFISTFVAFLLLYIAACVTVSVLGGIIDFILYEVFMETKLSYSPEDTFKMGFLRDGSPAVVTNILSRIPINIINRFVTIFGGFSLSLVIKRSIK
jgi:hypothetical protein